MKPELASKTTDGHQEEWMCGIEHLTQDQHGLTYWKGNLVECSSVEDPEERIKFARQTADICLQIETQGKEANFTNVVIYLKEKFAHLNVGYDVTRIKSPVDSEPFVTGMRPGI